MPMTQIENAPNARRMMAAIAAVVRVVMTNQIRAVAPAGHYLRGKDRAAAAGYRRVMNTAEAIGPQLRAWRMSRRVSQEQLAARAGVSSRHLSFVENGRSQPSRDMVLALAGALDVPLRDRNALLTAAGFAAAYRSSPLAGTDLAQVRRAIDHILRQQEPYGAAVVDGAWNVLELNRGATALLRRFPPTSADGLEAARNLVLATIHPDALRRYIVNWHEVAGHLVVRLHREIGMRP